MYTDAETAFQNDEHNLHYSAAHAAGRLEKPHMTLESNMEQRLKLRSDIAANPGG
jgi:hypothetical protein